MNLRTQESRTTVAWWRLPLLLAVALGAIVVARVSLIVEQKPPENVAPLPSPVATGKTVALVVDFGDGRRREIAQVPWQPEMTVDNLMSAASRLPDGITYTVHGDGEMMFLTGIDGVSGERQGGRHWTYEVNGVLGDRGLAVRKLEPGDRVLWRLGREQ